MSRILTGGRASRILISGIAVLISTGCVNPTPSQGMLMRAPWGEMAEWTFERADLVCTGTLTGSSRQLNGYQEWRSHYEWVPTPQVYEMDFVLDGVIYGPLELAGSVIRLRYVSSQPRGTDGALPDFVATVGDGRCLLYLVRHMDADPWYEILDASSFMLLGGTPDRSGWSGLSPQQRLEREVASAILSDQLHVALCAMRSATLAEPKLGGDVVGAFEARKSSQELQLKAEAVAALVRLGHKETLYELPGLLAAWNEAAPWAVPLVGEALRAVREPAFVPLLVELSRLENDAIRAGALHALRFIRSDDAVAALAEGLEERDLSLRYDAIMGLAYQTGNPEWTCTLSQFEKSPADLTAKWLRWWRDEGIIKYPSVEEVISRWRSGNT